MNGITILSKLSSCFAVFKGNAHTLKKNNCLNVLVDDELNILSAKQWIWKVFGIVKTDRAALDRYNVVLHSGIENSLVEQIVHLSYKLLWIVLQFSACKICLLPVHLNSCFYFSACIPSSKTQWILVLCKCMILIYFHT